MWFRVDDGFPFHAKTLAAGNAACGLWVRAGAWSMQHMTDGFVPKQVVTQIGTTREAARLVEVGLWVQKDGGYLFHEWDQRQPSRAQLTAEREAGAERKRLSRERRRGATSE